jgi:hypothetical protein
VVSEYRRPWWLLLNKGAGLVTTVQEEAKPGEQSFIIRGEPLVQGLAWLIWGPVAALLTILVLTWLAVTLNIREQSGTMRVFFIGLFLIIPALVWGGVILMMAQLSKKHVQAIRQAEAQSCTIYLRQRAGELLYQTSAPPTEGKVAYQHIQQAKVTYPIGERGGQKTLLTLKTDEGPLILLNENLGTPAQKNDLAQKIQYALETYPQK